jgi:hypothetical protein
VLLFGNKSASLQTHPLPLEAIIDNHGSVSYDLLLGLALSYAFPTASAATELVHDELDVTITYMDIDADCVTLSTTEELKDAIEQFATDDVNILCLRAMLRQKQSTMEIRETSSSSLSSSSPEADDSRSISSSSEADEVLSTSSSSEPDEAPVQNKVKERDTENGFHFDEIQEANMNLAAWRHSSTCSVIESSKMIACMQHASTCQVKVSGGCKECQQSLLRFDGMSCSESVGCTPLCLDIREKMLIPLQEQGQGLAIQEGIIPQETQELDRLSLYEANRSDSPELFCPEMESIFAGIDDEPAGKESVRCMPQRLEIQEKKEMILPQEQRQELDILPLYEANRSDYSPELFCPEIESIFAGIDDEPAGKEPVCCMPQRLEIQEKKEMILPQEQRQELDILPLYEANRSDSPELFCPEMESIFAGIDDEPAGKEFVCCMPQRLEIQEKKEMILPQEQRQELDILLAIKADRSDSPELLCPEMEVVADNDDEQARMLKVDEATTASSPLRNVIDGRSDITKTNLMDCGGNTLTAFFSFPLRRCDRERGLQDFNLEREVLWKCFKSASRDINVLFDTGSFDRLQVALLKKCTCLHFSGNGDENFLHFEDGDFGIIGLESLVEVSGGAPIRFVFLSSSNAIDAGNSFVRAGIPHVVCCENESKDSNTAALAFMQHFYSALANGRTVRDSFDEGRSIIIGDNVCRVALLPLRGDHSVEIFNAKPVPGWPVLLRTESESQDLESLELEMRNMMQEFPTPMPPPVFVGREVDMLKVLRALEETRLVSVVGETGVGRRSLVYALCHYINERRSTMTTIERIYYIRPSPVASCQTLILLLLDKLVKDWRTILPDCESHADVLIERVCHILNNEKALIVFDLTKWQGGLEDDDDFAAFLTMLIQDTRNVRVLLIGRGPIFPIDDGFEKTIQLKPLPFSSSIRLFANLCPDLRTHDERTEFCNRLAFNREKKLNRFWNDSFINKQTRLILGNGFPKIILEAAKNVPAAELEIIVDSLVDVP